MQNWAKCAGALALVGMGACQKAVPAPTPSLEGKWTQKHYVVTARDSHSQVSTSATSSAPGTFLVISSQAMEYHAPNLSAPVTDSYTRQGNKLFITHNATASKRTETIERLTADALALRTVRYTGAYLSDSTITVYHYMR